MIIIEDVKLICGDCLEEMDKLINQNMKVDAIITDEPYGTTKCKWDEIIPFDEMWNRLKLLRKNTSPIILFGSEPFSSRLRLSNIKEYKYDWYMKKNKPNGFLNAKKMPLKAIENIMIFYKKQNIYNPQGLILIDKTIKNTGTKNRGNIKENGDITSAHNKINHKYYKQKYTNYPINIITCSNGSPKSVHPTQKPVELMEYLIKTYTNEGDIILDFTMGSGTTGVACKNLHRKFIGIEKEQNYYDIAVDRINN